MIESNGDGLPAISVIVIDSRSHLKPKWVQKAVDSVGEQTLRNIELVILDNTERAHSIGKMFNQGVEKAKADWVFFLGDDDFISIDYLSSLKSFIDKYATEDTVVCTTYTTFFDDEKKAMSIRTNSAMGCFRREYLLENKFDEDLKKFVDVEMYKRLDAQGKKVKVCRWHFGAYYRQHGDNVSGRKNINPKG